MFHLPNRLAAGGVQTIQGSGDHSSQNSGTYFETGGKNKHNMLKNQVSILDSSWWIWLLYDREWYTRSMNWPVLSDEHSWAVWMAIFPAKWRANEQRLVGLEHLRVRIHCKDLCMEQQKFWITAHDSLSFVLYVRLWLCDFKYVLWPPRNVGKMKPIFDSYEQFERN